MKRILRVVGLVLMLVMAFPVAATAGGPYTGGGVTLSDTMPAPGASVDVRASGFQPNSNADIVFRSTPIVLASVSANAAGEVTATVTIPSDASGEHRIEVVGLAPDGSARTVSTSVSVGAGDASSAPLPSTGSSAAPAAVIALLVALVGVTLLVGTRVRRRAQSA